jgi:hypothetical protein
MNDDQGRPVPPHPPYDELRATLGNDAEARWELDALQQHLDQPNPDPSRVERHVDALRAVRTIEARIANWWDDPVTQRWFKSLSDAGL